MSHNNIRQPKITRKRPNYFQTRRRPHDPMLLLNMSVFNFAGGWNRVFDPIKVRENN